MFECLGRGLRARKGVSGLGGMLCGVGGGIRLPRRGVAIRLQGARSHMLKLVLVRSYATDKGHRVFHSLAKGERKELSWRTGQDQPFGGQPHNSGSELGRKESLQCLSR